jgi:transposase
VEKKFPQIIAEIKRDWPGQGPIGIMFQDEARFGRISDTRRCWCPKPFRPICRSMVSQEYTYAYAAVNVASGEVGSLILPHINGACMQIFVDEVASRYPQDRIVMILDGAGWHQAKDLKVPATLRLLSLPPYSPELNPVEHLWEEIREKYFHNKVFESLDALENHLCNALHRTELDTEKTRSIVAWPWILKALMN